ncbi:MAG TPA: HlyD family secretion protein [Caulobacteraceae bacterium]|nr:HlyD family secretion protein [Caulobacteraceae bacterium]
MSPPDSSEAPIRAAAPATTFAPPPPARRQGLLRRLRWPLMIGAVAIAIVIGFIVYLSGGREQSTDDAQVDGARVQVSSSISGRVVTIDVHEGQLVREGQLLFQLDGRPYQVAVQEAEANLQQAKQQIAAQKAVYQQRLADLRAAQATATYAAGEANRQRALVGAGTGTGATAAQAANQASQARAQVAAAQAAVANALAALGGNPNLPVDEQPTVKSQAARVAAASLNQGYIDIYAPQDGVVTKVDQLQVGDYINASQPVFSLVSNHFWISANFKENQLEYMRAGQRASIKLDAYPHIRFCARVSSISPGTGSSFSLLPAENATGNWVKVTQRVPVRLDFCQPAQVPLAAGLSATAVVDTGHRRTLFGGRQTQ